VFVRSCLWLSLPLLACGCPTAAIESTQNPPASTAPAAGEQAAQVAEEPHQNAFQREAMLVDRNAFLQEHPNATEIEKNVINSDGYLGSVSQGYFAAASQVTIVNLQHDLELQRNLDPNYRWPTFAKYKEILDTHGVKLKGLKKRQVYAYDDQTGNVSILELPEGEELPE
jgi:hypothetical protein